MSRAWYGWCVLGVVVAGLAGLAWSCRRQGAEVPILQPGGYVMHANGEECQVAFRPDGYFMRRAAGKWWRGTWKQKGAVLSVSETRVGSDEGREWSAELSSPREGTLDDGTPFRLEVRGREDGD